MLRISALTLSLGLSGLAADGPFFAEGQAPDTGGKTWVPVPELSDEFNGDAIDLEKWQTNPVGERFMWIGRPPGLFQAENVRVEDGSMKVEVGVLPEPVTIDGDEFLYKGAIVRSNHPGKLGQYFETRMKANATEMSSTFWLMTPYGSKQKLELDIQECVGTTNELTHDFAKNWDHVFHSNMIQRKMWNFPEPIQMQGAVETDVPNHSRFFVYGCWWKSEKEAQFFLDGKYVYSIIPSTDWTYESYLQMAMETYDWNPVPEDGGMVKRGTKEERTTSYDWIRVWQLTDAQATEAPVVQP